MPRPADPEPTRRGKRPGKEVYRRLRTQTCAQLWRDEVSRFDRAAPPERIAQVAVIRAVGTVFAESGTQAQRAAARLWLHGLLCDPAEKVRRYAAAALSALGAGPGDEAALLALLAASTTEREKKAVGLALGKIGGAATLAQMHDHGDDVMRATERTLKARLLRDQSPSSVNTAAVLADFADLRLHLRWRRGYEQIVAAEVEEHVRRRRMFRIVEVRSGVVALTPTAPFALADVYQLRCFDTVAFVLGQRAAARGADATDRLVAALTSPASQRILKTLTRGALRYRAEFLAKGQQRAAIARLADRAYALWPEFLNDPSQAPWTVSIYPAELGGSVELVPHVVPDPRLFYRLGDVPAASHPRLAACMARLAGPLTDAIVWDPFCGSGTQLVERALLGGVQRVHGSDLDARALRISRMNFAAAKLATPAEFTRADFRDVVRIRGLEPGGVDLIITNPPMGRRVRTPDVHRLIADLMSVAVKMLRPGGRLVLANPLHASAPPRALRLQCGQAVDFGGFDCRLEVYQKLV